MVKKKKTPPLHPASMGKRFFLKRKKDASGVSGCGRVAFGIQLPSGIVILEWLTDSPSLGIYTDLSRCLSIHGHDGDTDIEWIDNLEVVVVEEK